jgi:hypothetical protein
MRTPVVGIGQQEERQRGGGGDHRDGPHPRADPI